MRFSEHKTPPKKHSVVQSRPYCYSVTNSSTSVPPFRLWEASLFPMSTRRRGGGCDQSHTSPHDAVAADSWGAQVGGRVTPNGILSPNLRSKFMFVSGCTFVSSPRAVFCWVVCFFFYIAQDPASCTVREPCCQIRLFKMTPADVTGWISRLALCFLKIRHLWGEFKHPCSPVKRYYITASASPHLRVSTHWRRSGCASGPKRT